jgi:hypothetical protein
VLSNSIYRNNACKPQKAIAKANGFFVASDLNRTAPKGVAGHGQYIDSALAEWRGSLLFPIKRKRKFADLMKIGLLR